jgi:hypothetical protein
MKSRFDFERLAQPYFGSAAELADFLFPVRTTAELANAADAINTQNKKIGRMVWNSTLGQPVWADGVGPTNTWSLSTGVVAHTPS